MTPKFATLSLHRVRFLGRLFSMRLWNSLISACSHDHCNTFFRTQEVSSSGQAMDIDSATTGCEAEDGDDLSGMFGPRTMVICSN